MSAPVAEPTPGGTGYIRGSGGVEMDTRKVVRVVIALCLLALVGWAIALAVLTADQHSRQTRLQQHGIPVEVTVTGCVGLASGSGSTVDGYTCRGSYSLDGHLFNEVIEGTSAVHPVGQKLAAVTVRGDPALVSTAEGVPKRRSSWTAYTTPIVLGAVTIALALGLVLWPRRRLSPSEPEPASTDPVV